MMIDLKKLEAGLLEVDERELQIRRYINHEYEQREQYIAPDGYLPDDLSQEMIAIILEQKALYNPRLARRPFLDEAIAVYELVSAEERAAIRDIFAKVKINNGLLEYIIECAECLETPEDEDVFRLALIAASIEDSSFDFRDTHMVLAELAIAAVKAGINIEPHSTAIAELSNELRSRGGGLTKANLAKFHISAPKAHRLVPYDWINGVDLPADDPTVGQWP